NEATQRGLDAEHSEKVAGNVVGQDAVGLATHAEAVQADLVADEARKSGLRLLADVAVVRDRELTAQLPLLLLVGKHGDLRWVAHRQRSQQYPVHHTEDGGIGANTEGQSDDSDDRKSRFAPKHPDSILDVLEQAFHARTPAVVLSE